MGLELFRNRPGAGVAGHHVRVSLGMSWDVRMCGGSMAKWVL